MCLIYGEDDERLIFKFLNGLFLCYLQIELNLFTWQPFFPTSVHQFFSPISLLFYGRFHVFLTIAICIYLCFAREVLFRSLAFSSISHTTRISNITSFLCKRLVVKKIISKQSLPLYKTEMFCAGHSKPEDLTSK